MFIVLFVRAAVGIDCFAKILRWEPLRYSHPTFFPLSLGEPAPQMAGQGMRVYPLGCFELYTEKFAAVGQNSRPLWRCLISCAVHSRVKGMMAIYGLVVRRYWGFSQ